MTTGNDIVTLANKHIGERYLYGASVPKDNPNWSGPWDCAEFASWVAYQTVGLLVGCLNNHANPALANAYSGAWADDAVQSHRPISLGQARATAGAFLIRKPAPGADGHVAISRGDGTTVEAHSTKHGVSAQKFDGRRWDLAVLLPLVNYPNDLLVGIYAPPSGLVLRLTYPPMHGEIVKRLQQALKVNGIDPGEIDGIYGPHTAAAVHSFQLQSKMLPDGEAGPLTFKKLGL